MINDISTPISAIDSELVDKVDEPEDEWRMLKILTSLTTRELGVKLKERSCCVASVTSNLRP